MKTILLLFLLLTTLTKAQHLSTNDPYPTLNITQDIKIQVDKFYPIFGVSEKPFTNEKIIKLTDLNDTYTVYIFFKEEYTPPKYDKKSKTIRLYFPDTYYNYIIQRLEKDTAFILYREYKEGHSWGEIYFDKYP